MGLPFSFNLSYFVTIYLEMHTRKGKNSDLSLMLKLTLTFFLIFMPPFWKMAATQTMTINKYKKMKKYHKKLSLFRYLGKK